jgi:hypothetical protein
VNFPDLIRNDAELLVPVLNDCWRFRELNAEETQRLSGYSELVQSLSLPTKELTNCSHSGREVLQMVEEFLIANIRLSSNDYTAVAAFIISTFFSDVLPVIPTMALVSRVPAQAVAAFAAIGSICRNAIIMDHTVPLVKVPLFLSPTLAIDATGLTGSQLQGICPLSSPVIRRMIGSRVESVRASRLILSREVIGGASMNFVVRAAVAARSSPSDLRSLIDALASYRLRTRKLMPQQETIGYGLSDIFVRCFPADDATQERVAAAVCPIDQHAACAVIDKNNEENFLLQVLFAAVHKDACIPILKLASLTTDIFQREGIRWKVSPRFVANFLRCYGFTVRHTRIGLLLEIDERTRSIAHRLYREALSPDIQLFEACEFCRQIPPTEQTVH